MGIDTNEEIIQQNNYDHNVVISNFEGPLDLLCYLVSKNKMEIFDISLNELVDNYVNYLKEMESLNMDIATDFIVMGSTLVYLKSKKLLPMLQPEEEVQEEITEEELMAKIAEYQKYKEVQESLRKMYQAGFGCFEKLPENIKYSQKQIYKESIDYSKIYNLYNTVLRRNIEKMNVKAAEVERIALYEKVTVKSKILQIINAFKHKSNFIFGKLFDSNKNKKIDIVTAFLGILELSKLKKVSINQNELFGDIEVNKITDEEIDLSLIKE